jgi:hypothetical protein
LPLSSPSSSPCRLLSPCARTRASERDYRPKIAFRVEEIVRPVGEERGETLPTTVADADVTRGGQHEGVDRRTGGDADRVVTRSATLSMQTPMPTLAWAPMRYAREDGPLSPFSTSTLPPTRRLIRLGPALLCVQNDAFTPAVEHRRCA